MADHFGTRAGTEPSVDQTADLQPGVTTGAAGTNSRLTYRILGLYIAGLGVVHLIKRRFFPTFVPDWLGPVRHEIDLAAGGLKVLVGIVVMLIPLLRRWANMAPPVVSAVPATVDEAGRP